MAVPFLEEVAAQTKEGRTTNPLASEDLLVAVVGPIPLLEVRDIAEIGAEQEEG